MAVQVAPGRTVAGTGMIEATGATTGAVGVGAMTGAVAVGDSVGGVGVRGGSVRATNGLADAGGTDGAGLGDAVGGSDRIVASVGEGWLDGVAMGASVGAAGREPPWSAPQPAAATTQTPDRRSRHMACCRCLIARGG